MSTLDDAALSGAISDLSAARDASRWDRFEAVLGRLSERLNPILVKEARQALRSRQFTTTFFLTLAAGWLWSIIGLAWLGPEAAYSAAGATMFYGYHLVLAFPLLIVAPYSAFHSLSSERQDRTFELVSITALDARQILSGKLSSIMLQMLVYLSAIFPCLAFTYLLRGIDIFTILLVVLYTCLLSLGLSAIGLLFATLAPPRQRPIASGVAFAMLAFGAFGANAGMIASLLGTEGALIETSEFWEVNALLLTIYLNLFALVFLAARSQLTTICQNRSTALRVALVVTQLSMLGWTAYAQLRFGGNFVYFYIFLSAIFWWFAGIFLTGESPNLSPRDRARLAPEPAGKGVSHLVRARPGHGLPVRRGGHDRHVAVHPVALRHAGRPVPRRTAAGQLRQCRGHDRRHRLDRAVSAHAPSDRRMLDHRHGLRDDLPGPGEIDHVEHQPVRRSEAVDARDGERAVDDGRRAGALDDPDGHALAPQRAVYAVADHQRGVDAL